MKKLLKRIQAVAAKMWHSEAWSARNGRKGETRDYIKIGHNTAGHAEMMIHGDPKKVLLALSVCIARNPAFQEMILTACETAQEAQETEQGAEKFLRTIKNTLDQ